MVELNIQEFRSAYPNFILITDDELNELWFFALFYIQSVTVNFTPPEIKQKWNYLSLAHLCQLELDGTVGILSQSTTGTVNNTLSTSLSGEWWRQTTYGARIWQAMNMFGRCMII